MKPRNGTAMQRGDFHGRLQRRDARRLRFCFSVLLHTVASSPTLCRRARLKNCKTEILFSLIFMKIYCKMKNCKIFHLVPWRYVRVLGEGCARSDSELAILSADDESEYPSRSGSPRGLQHASPHSEQLRLRMHIVCTRGVLSALSQ